MAQASFAFLAALATGFLATPVVRRLAIRIGAVDRPVKRSVHTEPKPYLGGVAIFAAFALATFLFADVAHPVRGAGLRGIVAGGAVMLALGVADDLWRLPPSVKFAGQVLAATVPVVMGVRIEYVGFLGDYSAYLQDWDWLSGLLTVFWIVSVTNAVNLSDGLDGLAAGISTIASVTLLLVAMRQGQADVVVLTAILAGATLGFLPHNFNPAKIFMGDGGSLFLGYALGAISVEGMLKSATTVALVIPVLALGLPIADTLFAIVRRAANGRPFHEADRGHLHHRLMQLGLSHRETVLVMWSISGWLGISAIALTELGVLPSVIVVLFIGATLFYGAKKVGILDLERKNNFHD